MTSSGDMLNARKNSLHQREILYQSNSDNTSNGICDGPSGMDDMRSLSESGASVRVVKTDMEKGGVPRVTKLSQENNSRILQKGGEGRDNSDILVQGGEGVHRLFQDNLIQSPISRKKTIKSKSVAEIKKSFVQEYNTCTMLKPYPKLTPDT